MKAKKAKKEYFIHLPTRHNGIYKFQVKDEATQQFAYRAIYGFVDKCLESFAVASIEHTRLLLDGRTYPRDLAVTNK